MSAALSDVFPSNGPTRVNSWAGVAGNILLNNSQFAIEGLRNSLLELARLPNNWDSYGAPRISADAIDAALNTLTDILSSGAPSPHLIPTPCGGIQAEWHSGPKSLELDFVSPVQIELYFEDESVGDTEEETLMFDLAPIYQKLAEF